MGEEKKEGSVSVEEMAAALKAVTDSMAAASQEEISQETVSQQEVREPEPEPVQAAAPEEPQPKKKRIPVLPVILGLLVLVAAGTGGFYVYQAKQYETQFLPNTSINGINAEGMTIDEVKAIIESGLDGYALTLIKNGDTSEQITRSEIGLHTVFDQSMETILAAQEPMKWFQERNIPKEYHIETALAYDEALLDARIESLSAMDPANWVEPENAKISEYDMEANCYTIVPETAGTTLVPQTVKPVVSEAILNGETEVDLGAEGCYTKAAITSENPTLAAVAAELNTYVGAVINYTFGDETEVFDGDVIHEWLSLDGTTVTLDESQAAVYAAELAEKYDTAGKPKKLMTSYGAEVEITTGTYGWRIDQKKEAEAILEVVKSGEQQTREPAYSQTAASHGETDYGDTYVEVNLFTQHLFFYKDGELIIESDLVSGNEARRLGTPDGAYPIAYKQRNAVLRGQKRADGSYEYESPVSYWMPYNGGIGLHDASWRGKFGGTIYKYSGSHGCVNLPRTTARTIFENIERGDPVLSYRLDPSTIPEPETEEEKTEETVPETEAAAPVTTPQTTTQTSKPAAQPTKPAQSSKPATQPTTAAQTKPAPTQTAAPAETEPAVPETAVPAPEAPGDAYQETQPAETEAVPETTAPALESGGDKEGFGPGFMNVPPAEEGTAAEYGPGM